jgi:hypothetical protein
MLVRLVNIPLKPFQAVARMKNARLQTMPAQPYERAMLSHCLPEPPKKLGDNKHLRGITLQTNIQPAGKKDALCNFLSNREKIADSLSVLSTGILLINSLCLRYLSFFVR